METQIGGKLERPKLAKLDLKWMEIRDPADLSTDNTKECKAHAYKRFTTFLYLENTDRTMYGTLLSRLATQYSLGLDQYPQTAGEATVQMYYRITSSIKPTRTTRRSNCKGIIKIIIISNVKLIARSTTRVLIPHCLLHKWKTGATVVVAPLTRALSV